MDQTELVKFFTLEANLMTSRLTDSDVLFLQILASKTTFFFLLHKWIFMLWFNLDMYLVTMQPNNYFISYLVCKGELAMAFCWSV